MKKKVYIKTFGCKVNFYDENYFVERLKENFCISDNYEDADIYIVNSCTVTGKAESESRRFAGKMKNLFPDSVVIYTGCGAEVCGEDYLDRYGIDFIVGNSSKREVVNIVKDLTEEKIYKENSRFLDLIDITGVKNFSSTRAFLKIQEGCDLFCSYCIVPFTRGKSRSLKIQEVLRQMRVLADNGYNEIVLVGIHVGLFGFDNNENLLMLLKAINNEKIVSRVRLTSLDPHEVTDELFNEIAGSEVILPHFHLSFQSGNDGILKRMGRRYKVAHLVNVVNKIVDNIDVVGIGVDIIVGFPGESNEDFMNTFKLLNDLPINYIHPFTYSDRPMTASVKFADKVSNIDKKNRMHKILEIDNMKRRNWAESSVGSKRQVLLEDYKNGVYSGYSEDYLPVKVYCENTDLHNKVVDVIINSTEGKNVTGTII